VHDIPAVVICGGLDLRVGHEHGLLQDAHHVHSVWDFESFEEDPFVFVVLYLALDY